MTNITTMTHQHIKRPANHFMIWSCEKRQHYLIEKSKNKNKCNVKINNSEMSKMLGREWANLPNECKLKYKQKADILKLEHKRMYPNYKYEPKSKKLKNIRSPRVKKDIQHHSQEHQVQKSHIHELEYTNEGTVKKYMVCTTNVLNTYHLDETSIYTSIYKSIDTSIETSIDTNFSIIMEHIFADKSNTSDVYDVCNVCDV